MLNIVGAKKTVLVWLTSCTITALIRMLGVVVIFKIFLRVESALPICAQLLFMGNDSEPLESLEFHGLHCNVCAQPPSSDSGSLECAVSKPPDFPTEAKYQWYFIQISHNYISYKYHTISIQISYKYRVITHCIHSNADIASHGYSKWQSISAGCDHALFYICICICICNCICNCICICNCV